MAREDDALIRLSVAEMLESRGHRVFEADRASKAAQLHGEHRIDLLLTDVGLPDASGIELVRTLRTRSPDLSVLFATGRADVHDLPHDGRTAWIRKPYSADDLLQAIDALHAPPSRVTAPT